MKEQNTAATYIMQRNCHLHYARYSPVARDAQQCSTISSMHMPGSEAFGMLERGRDNEVIAVSSCHHT
jgi:hypothetical protein